MGGGTSTLGKDGMAILVLLLAAGVVVVTDLMVVPASVVMIGMGIVLSCFAICLQNLMTILALASCLSRFSCKEAQEPPTHV